MAHEDKKIEEVIPHACNNFSVSSSVVDRTIAKEYVDKHGLTIHYHKELRDGTPRRVWDIHDPSGHMAGRLYTAVAGYGLKNREPWKDEFDFAEFFVNRDRWDDKELIAPDTKHFNNIAG